MTVENFNGDTSVDGYVEIRGVVSSDKSISFKEMTRYNEQFNIDQYEEMVTFANTVCRSNVV